MTDESLRDVFPYAHPFVQDADIIWVDDLGGLMIESMSVTIGSGATYAVGKTASSGDWAAAWEMVLQYGKCSVAAEVIRDWWINVYYAPDVGPYSSVLEASFEALKLRAKDRQTSS